MAEINVMIMPMLRQMRKELCAGFAGLDVRLEEVDKRFERMEGQLRTFRQALAAMR